MSDKPLPCLRCGSPALLRQTLENRFSVGCTGELDPSCIDIGSMMPWTRRTLAEAIAAWNKRSAPPASPAPVAGGAEAGWIGVEERLPEVGVKVLVGNRETGCFSDFVDTARYEHGCWCNDNWHRDLAVNEVSHWMPLPSLSAALASPPTPQPADPSVRHDALTITPSVETARATNESAHARSASATQPAEAETGVVAALKDCAAFIAVMFGDVNGTVPEAVITPIGVQVKLGQLMREASAALASPSGTEAAQARRREGEGQA